MVANNTETSFEIYFWGETGRLLEYTIMEQAGIVRSTNLHWCQ